ncbi:hypothetical protein AG0111_0g4855 [Alternaria gaisen]|uniref:Uncharacterized protein n=1 Tax=Alternaria gaisen TaxID=167740 RepID=A0ACB6FRM7_9PLEO|nr:hypothetical protein AG0111_0g4855 [Alternaria gaisen]
MKSFLILTAFTSSVLASAIQLPNHLMDRDIDPATMNPTLFSVLSVLKTGMPTGPNVPMPTGNSEPDWYQRLPEDVKSLLPSFYPVAPTAQAVVAAATIRVHGHQHTITFIFRTIFRERITNTIFYGPGQCFSHAIEFPFYWC